MLNRSKLRSCFFAFTFIASRPPSFAQKCRDLHWESMSLMQNPQHSSGVGCCKPCCTLTSQTCLSPMPTRASSRLKSNSMSSNVRACDAWFGLLTQDQYLCLLRSYVQTAATTGVAGISNASVTVDDHMRQGSATIVFTQRLY